MQANAAIDNANRILLITDLLCSLSLGAGQLYVVTTLRAGKRGKRGKKNAAGINSAFGQALAD
jgi:hypothetical protein